jgi:hypothetical protein
MKHFNLADSEMFLLLPGWQEGRLFRKYLTPCLEGSCDVIARPGGSKGDAMVGFFYDQS